MKRISRHLLLLVAALAACAALLACGEKAEPEVAAPIPAPSEPQPVPGPNESPEPEPEPTPPEPEPNPPRPPAPAGDQIAVAVRGVLASGNPDLACRRYATGRLLAESFGGLAGCVAATKPRTAADSVRLIDLEINGRSARLVAIPRGGTSSGQRVRVTLLVQEGLWRVDSLRSNVPVGP